MQKAGMSTVAIDSYTYITDHPADAAPLPAPSESNLPFRAPERIPDADLPKILDAASASSPPIQPFPSCPFTGSSPIPTATMRVIFGWMTAPRSGHGTQVELQPRALTSPSSAQATGSPDRSHNPHLRKRYNPPHAHKHFFTAVCLLLTSAAYAASPPDWQLVWSDEFNTPGRPDPAKWNLVTGFHTNEKPVLHR